MIMVAIVIVIIPVAVVMPAAIVLVPPFVFCFPAVFARLAQFMSSVFGLIAPITVVFDCFVHSVVGAGYPSLAIVAIGMEPWYRCKGKANRQRRSRHNLIR
jgi:hypothetical protein